MLKRTETDTKSIRKTTLVVVLPILVEYYRERQNPPKKEVDKGSVLKTRVRANVQVKNEINSKRPRL